MAFSEKHAKLSQTLAAITGLSALFAIIGYLYGVPLLYGSVEYTSMALHTGVGFLVGSLSLLFCRPDLGLMSVLTNSYPGGWLARRLLPVTAIVPALLGGACIHSRLFSSDVRLNIACLVVAQIVLFMTLVWILAFVLNRAEAEKAVAQDALARSEKLLQQSQRMEAIGLLAGGVAHDFNNLLAVINGYSDLLLERADLPDADRRSLEQIKQAGNSAASLTRQLLMLSRQQVVEPVVLNINQTVGNLDKMLRRLIKENIEFSFVLDPQLDRVKADPGTDRTDCSESGSQRTRRHAPRRQPSHPDEKCREGGYASGPGRITQPLCAAGSDRHRHRHGPANPGAHIRTILHHQSRGQGNRAGSGDGLRNREAEQRPHRSPEHAGARIVLPDFSSCRGPGMRRSSNRAKTTTPKPCFREKPCSWSKTRNRCAS